MTTHTPAQKAQLIEFYQASQARVDRVGLYNLPPANQHYYILGKRYAKQQREFEAAAARKGTRYTDAEATALCNLYIQNGGDMFAARSAFFAQFPESKHSASSVYMKLSRIRTLDSQWENDTEWQTDSQLSSILQELDADRFSN